MSVTTIAANTVIILTTFYYIAANVIQVATNITDVTHVSSGADNPFMVFIY